MSILLKILRLRTWHLLLISVICSEVFTLLLNTLQSIIWWKKVSSDLLLIGTIDAFVVSLVVTSFMLYIMRFSLGILFEKEALEREMIDRTKAEEALRLSESKYRNLIENIEEKHGRSGPFVLVTMRTTYIRQDGTTVAEAVTATIARP